MSKRSVIHASFTLERTYDAAPQRVFHAFAERAAKARWFARGEDWETGTYELDFQVGGRERWNGRHRGGPVVSFDSVYQDIVPNERIIYSYDMHIDRARISVSLATIQLEPVGAGTRLTFTEHGAFLDGHDNPAQREQGTRELLDALGAELESER